MVLLEHLDRQFALCASRLVHHRAAKPPVMQGRIQKQPADFGADQSDEAHDLAVKLGHSGFGNRQIDRADVVRFLIEESRALKRVCLVTGLAPDFNDGAGVFGLEFSDHRQTGLSRGATRCAVA